MFFFATLATLSVLALAPIRDFGAEAHVSFFHPSMYGFNITSASDPNFSYDNRPVTPLADYTFDQWWFHGHLGFPPNKGDVFELPAGGVATTEIACTKSATSFFDPATGGDIRRKDNPNDPCPGSGMEVYHTNGFNDLKGCGLAIAYESDVSKIQPEDMTIFSINQTCVWTRFTDFQVPARMPACPPGGCTCAWFWIHSEESGSEQNYMTGFKCNITGAQSTVPLAEPQVPRRCGADPKRNIAEATPGNCTYGAKQPLYWFQKERNNVFEDQYAPPFYNDLYNFRDGAQNDIFVDSYQFPLPKPSVNQTIVPQFFAQGTGANANSNSNGASSSTLSSATSSAAPQATGAPGAGGSSTGASPSPSPSSLSALAASSSVATSSVTQTITSTRTSVVVATETQTVVVVATSTAVVTKSVVPSAASIPASTGGNAASTAIVVVLPSASSTVANSPSSAFPITTIKLGGATSTANNAAAEPSSSAPAALRANAGLTAGVLAETNSSDNTGPGGAQQKPLQACKRDGEPSARIQESRKAQKNMQRRAQTFHASNSFKKRVLREPKDLWRIF